MGATDGLDPPRAGGDVNSNDTENVSRSELAAMGCTGQGTDASPDVDTHCTVMQVLTQMQTNGEVHVLTDVHATAENKWGGKRMTWVLDLAEGLEGDRGGACRRSRETPGGGLPGGFPRGAEAPVGRLTTRPRRVGTKQMQLYLLGGCHFLQT